jgi:ABC-type enterochelin transport system substrate-binding protein
MKVIIAGGRNFNDYNKLRESCDNILVNQNEVEIVSGTAAGADTLGERYAQEKGYEVKKFPAQWDLYGKSAGYKRNQQMAEYADGLIAFWDGKSKGTKHMIDIANKMGLKVRVIRYL